MTEAEQDEWAERAAILEYDAGLPRQEAERRATEIIKEKRLNNDPRND